MVSFRVRVSFLGLGFRVSFRQQKAADDDRGDSEDDGERRRRLRIRRQTTFDRIRTRSF